MAVVDSQYKYVMIDVGAEGRKSDGGIFKDSQFGRALANGTLDIPSLGLLPGTSATAAPFAFVGDEAFQLRKDFLRPFPSKQLRDERRVFNYRLSRARYCATRHNIDASKQEATNQTFTMLMVHKFLVHRCLLTVIMRCLFRDRRKIHLFSGVQRKLFFAKKIWLGMNNTKTNADYLTAFQITPVL